MILYVVRDALPDGAPAPWVSVWLERPELVEQPDGGLRWCGCPAEYELPRGWVANLWLAEASKEFGGYPSDQHRVHVVRRRSAEDRERVRGVLAGIERRAAR